MSNLQNIPQRLHDAEESVRPERSPRPRLAVVVLGMHRSGTSAIAGLISKLGLGLPSDLLDAQGDNETGFFESREVMMAHERLFAAVGTSWDGLEDLDGVENTPAGQTFIEEMKVYLETEFERSPQLLLKDPRICRLTSLWLPLIEHLDADIVSVHAVRNPLAVAASLAKRNKFAPERSMLIWLEHVLRAERSTRGMRRLFVNFDDILADWRNVVQQFALVSGLEGKLNVATKVEIETFLSGSLRHHSFQSSDVLDDESLPDWMREPFETFEQATKGRGEPDERVLDHAWANFEKARKLFSPLISDHLAEISKKVMEVKSERTRAEAAEAREAAAVQEATARANELAEVRQASEAAEAREAAAVQEATARANELAEVRQALEAAEAREAAAVQEATARTNELAEVRQALEAERDGAEQSMVALANAREAEGRLAQQVSIQTMSIQEAHAELKQTVAMAEAHQATLSTTQDRVRELERDLARDNESALRLQRRVDELQSLTQYLNGHTQALEKTIREIRASTSWKISAPLRKLKSVGRNARTPHMPSIKSKTNDSDPSEPSGGAVAADSVSSQPLTPALRTNVRIQPRQAPVDIIIPVYRGLDTTMACIESVFASDPGVDHVIIIIDDCSPEPEVSAYIANLAGRTNVIVLRNEENLGFVGTVNRGMSLHPDRDIVLLNSDTEVANNWLQRIQAAAYSDIKISSVTPFSNNATICSYPRYCDENDLPENLSLAQLDDLFAEANFGKTVNIPTAVGFCMFIRRDSLDAVGLFDEEAFGKGYGEENDFCLRSAKDGWRHVLATDVFVFHKGGVSFKESAILEQERGAEVIRKRWPEYFGDVARHVSRDPERNFRIAATALRYKRDPRPVILIITHAYGGGVERQIDDLKAMNGPYALFLTLRPMEEGRVRLESDAKDGVNTEFHLGLEGDKLVRLLKDFGLARIHLHHTLRYPDTLKEMIAQTGVPFDFTIHDYYAICPRIHLGATTGSYCGEPDDSACNTCIRRDFPVYDRTITEYRESRAWMVRSAERVIAPSHDTARRFRRYFLGLDIEVVPHASDRTHAMAPTAPALQRGERLRVLVLGVLAPHKGLSCVSESVGLADETNAPIEFHLLGQYVGDAPDSSRFINHGVYHDPDLDQRINDVDPHIIWFPALVPETFSFTLEAALASGRPIAASDLGAFPERLSGRAWTWIRPWLTGAHAYLEFFKQLRSDAFMIGKSAAPHASDLPTLTHDGFYQLRYLKPLHGKAPSVGNRARRKIVAVDHSVIPTACGQIRVELPLTHPTLADAYSLQVLPFEEAMRADADAILVQRTAITYPDDASRLADHCDRKGIRKLFEIDDDLFALPESHPEKKAYGDLLRGAKEFLSRADHAIVTTPVLAERLAAFNANTVVVPNYLDDRLWFTGGRGQPRHRVQGEKLRVAFIGSSTHAEDLELIKAALQRCNEARPGQLEFHLVGCGLSDTQELDIIQNNPPPALAGNYVRFVEWLRRSANWHVGIAPLVPSAFNLAKSPLKFLDYGALGLAGIYSNQSPFSSVVEDGQTGLFAGGMDDWAESLIRLVDDESLRLALAESARAEIRNRHTLQSNGQALRDVWDELTG